MCERYHSFLCVSSRQPTTRVRGESHHLCGFQTATATCERFHKQTLHNQQRGGNLLVNRPVSLWHCFRSVVPNLFYSVAPDQCVIINMAHINACNFLHGWRFGWLDGVKRALNDRRMDIREASERARNRNEWQMIVTQFWLTSVVVTGLPYRGNPVVGAVGEMASVKRRKLWKTGEDGLCCSSSAIQTRLGPSSLLEEQSGVPVVFVVLVCCRLPPKLGQMAKVYR